MTEPKLVFDSSVGSLVRAARGRLSSAGAKKVAALGIPVQGQLAPHYPADTWASCVKIMSADLYPDVNAIEAQRLLAHLTVDQFAETIVGTALFSLTRLLGLERTLKRMTANFRAGSNFIETRLDVVGERHWNLWLNDVTGVPGFFQGLVEAGVKASAARLEEMRIKAVQGRSCTYEIRGG